MKFIPKTQQHARETVPVLILTYSRELVNNFEVHSLTKKQ